MYNTGVFVAMGIIVLHHWPPLLRLRLQTDPELQTSSGKEQEGQYTSTGDEREKKNTKEVLTYLLAVWNATHGGSSPESMIRCGAITGFWINWQVFLSKSFSVSSFLTLSLTNLHLLLLLTNDFPLWGRNQEKWDWKYRKSKAASRVGHEHLWAWDYYHLLILLAKRPYLIKTPLIWSWPSKKRTQKAHKDAHQTTEHQAETEEGSEDLNLYACGCVFRPIYTHNEKCSWSDRVTK